MSKKVLVSACLLGELCRYDAKTKSAHGVIDALKGYEIIPFCPEAPIFGTPRQRINVVEVGGENRIFTDETQVDVTKLLEDEINSFLRNNPRVDKIVLKSKSPSCGHGTTPILNERKEVIKHGDGIAAQILKNHFKDVEIEDESSYWEVAPSS